ncbi:pentapeptide repeat-containing protein, partial [Anabaena azotica]
EAFNVIKINNFGTDILWLFGLVGLCAASVRFGTVSVSFTIFGISIVDLIIVGFVRLHEFSFDSQLLMNNSLFILTLALANFLVFICANFGAFCGVLGYVVDEMKVLILSSLVGLLVAIGYTLFGLSSPKLAVTLLTILVATLLSIYQAWSAINGQPRQLVILRIANDLTSDWGTRFYSSNLTDANFDNANLKNADFTKAIGVKREHQ